MLLDAAVSETTVWVSDCYKTFPHRLRTQRKVTSGRLQRDVVYKAARDGVATQPIQGSEQ
jgi:hypothetical protein